MPSLPSPEDEDGGKESGVPPAEVRCYGYERPVQAEEAEHPQALEGSAARREASQAPPLG